MNPRKRVPPPSGRFVLRIEAGLHAALRRAAAAAGMSLNEYCAHKLAAPAGSHGEWRGAADVVSRAAALFGETLVGVVAFGSWSRNEQRESSDVDVLVVVDRSVELTRELYRRWDETPLAWDGHTVEAHFAHLPAAAHPPSGLWAEVAVDGVLLFARSQEVSAYLAMVRRHLADGRVVRKVTHGQSYWVEVA